MKKTLVSLTFDDGYRSQFEDARPILYTYGYTATFYCITKFFAEYSGDHMTERMVSALSKDGHEIGAHTVTHPYLWQFWKRHEILESKEQLEILLHKPIRSFAYPYGRYNDTVVGLVKEAGYQNARALRGDYDGYNFSATSRYKICSKAVRWNTTPEEVEQWIEEAERNELWLVLVFHQISESRYRWGCTPAMLDTVCLLLQVAGCDIQTVSEACESFHQVAIAS